ncbi:MAG: hypothetical protein ACJ746_17625 [Bryobacteraceae bacterium]
MTAPSPGGGESQDHGAADYRLSVVQADDAAYPSGGESYIVARQNRGTVAGLLAVSPSLTTHFQLHDVGSAQGGPVRDITSESSDEDMASWSHDGKWIYFESDRSGVFQIWKVPFAGGTAVQVTKDGGADAFESRDGKFVYYTKWEQRGIWRKPVEGGPDTLIITAGRKEATVLRVPAASPEASHRGGNVAVGGRQF